MSTRSNRMVWVAVLPMVFAVFLFQGDFARGFSNELFTDTPIFIEKTKQDPTIIRSRYVMVDFDFLTGIDNQGADTLVLNLFSDLSLKAIKQRVEKRTANSYSWFGYIEDVEYSQVILVMQGGIITGNITVGERMFQIRSVGGGVQAIREIDQSAFPDEAPPMLVERPWIQPHFDSKEVLDSGDTIDVLVVYTADAASGAGGISEIDSLIQLAIDETNQSYANSMINQRVRLVHKAQVNYTESGDVCLDRTRVRDPYDGFMDEVHMLRDTYSADIVVLFVENGGNYCGCSYIMDPVSVDFEDYAFACVVRDCATGYYSFGHEMGHLMSARHDWYADKTDNSPYTYNHGYVYLQDKWRTMMAYNSECQTVGFNCTRLQYWSNPNVLYGGVPMGVPEGSYHASDNRKTLNNTAYTVANFRQSISPYQYCLTDGRKIEFNLIDGLWLVGKGSSSSCGKSDLVGLVYQDFFAFNLDMKTGTGCPESIFYFGHVSDLSYKWINTAGNKGSDVIITCTPSSLKMGEETPSFGDVGIGGGNLSLGASYCFEDNYDHKFTFDFDGYYLQGSCATDCGPVSLIGAVEKGIFSWYCDIPSGSDCEEGFIYGGSVSSLNGVWRDAIGNTGNFTLSPCTSSPTVPVIKPNPATMTPSFSIFISRSHEEG